MAARALRRSISVLSLVAVAGLMTSVPAHAATPTTPPALVAFVSSIPTSLFPLNYQLGFDSLAGDTTVTATTAGIRVRVQGISEGSHTLGVDFTPPTGQSLHVGRYSYHGASTALKGSFAMRIDPPQDPVDPVGPPSDAIPEELSHVDVNDLAVDDTGAITRFDLDFVSPGQIGEVRWHEPAAADHVVSATRVTWPTEPVDAPVRESKVWVHNTTSAPLAVHPATLSGADPSDFVILQDGCAAESPIAAYQWCPVVVGYRPSGPGDYQASLSVPAGASIDVVALSGNSPSGYTGVITSGDDFVDRGLTWDMSDDGWQTSISGDPHYLQVDSVPLSGATSDLADVIIDPPSGSEIGTGVHPFGPAVGDYTLTASGHGRGCDSYSGTMDIHRFDLAADGETPVAVDISFDALCDGVPMTGRLQYQVPVAVTVTAPAQTRYDAPATVAGQAPAGALVTLFVHRNGQTGYSAAASTHAGLDGSYRFDRSPTVDERYYATVDGVASPSVLHRIAPAISGPTTKVVGKRAVIAVTGTAAAGSVVQLHVHTAEMKAGRYGSVRTARATAAGGWRVVLPSGQDYRVYATTAAGTLASAADLIQSR